MSYYEILYTHWLKYSFLIHNSNLEGDKAHALQKVAEYLGRDIHDMTVFGDSVNDIGMFKLAGTSVAVSNALDEVKEVADVILPLSNDEDGVAKYLSKI